MDRYTHFKCCEMRQTKQLLTSSMKIPIASSNTTLTHSNVHISDT